MPRLFWRSKSTWTQTNSYINKNNNVYLGLSLLRQRESFGRNMAEQTDNRIPYVRVCERPSWPLDPCSSFLSLYVAVVSSFLSFCYLLSPLLISWSYTFTNFLLSFLSFSFCPSPYGASRHNFPTRGFLPHASPRQTRHQRPPAGIGFTQNTNRHETCSWPQMYSRSHGSSWGLAGR
jgi:hypothetical protein